MNNEAYLGISRIGRLGKVWDSFTWYIFWNSAVCYANIFVIM
jgi:hypothetical protein